VDPGEIQELADSIQLILTDSSLVKHLGIKARVRAVNKFSWDNIAKRIMKIYRIHLEG
jgi:glycosyltransferase involved in cell wall biosynthesis